MKLIGTKEKGYKLVSSFEKPAEKPKNDKGSKDSDDKGSKDFNNK